MNSFATEWTDCPEVAGSEKIDPTNYTPSDPDNVIQFHDPAIDDPPPVTTPGQQAAFAYMHAFDLDGVDEVPDFVETILTDGGASVVYGPSNCGKTFWIVDLGVAVASGRKFRGNLEVDRGGVIYIALEGKSGAKNRIAALKKSGLLRRGDPFYIIFESVSLIEKGSDKKLAETVAQITAAADTNVKLVIIDTLSRAMAGGDENSGVDMGLVVKAIDAVRGITGAHVCVVHHCGKDMAKGARGFSGLRAAIDTEIEIFRNDEEMISTVRVTKQRDLSIGPPMPFSLEVVKLGINRRGKDITSCVVHHEDVMMAGSPAAGPAKHKEKPGKEKADHGPALLDLLPQPTTKSWEYAADRIGIPSRTFYRAKDDLYTSKKILKSKSGWSVNQPSFGPQFYPTPEP